MDVPPQKKNALNRRRSAADIFKDKEPALSADVSHEEGGYWGLPPGYRPPYPLLKWDCLRSSMKFNWEIERGAP